ncbi:hypothetical protein Vadar_024345 [Vaccinium darrowii]|uniref:Uncharacterized protein n=1 Tax=Vaccinium darrowii TaxID=229202 RepID=A0ACB7ZLI2_9ERIC|nr:hypothetical protein Vadar_024345 [Vaccinium darrowii]
MAATAISLHFRTRHRRRPISNPPTLHFFSSSSSSSTPSDSTNAEDRHTPSSPPPPPPQSQSQSQSQSSWSSYFSDVKARLKQNPSHQQQQIRNPLPPFSFAQTPSKAASHEKIRKNLAEFSLRHAAPHPADNSSPQQQQPLSIQELYKRRSENSAIEASNEGRGGGNRSFDAIRESLRQMKPKQAANNTNQATNNNDPLSLLRFKDILKMKPVDPNGGTDNQLPDKVFGKEMREKKEKKENEWSARTEFLRNYTFDELGQKLRKLRPEGKKGEWFSFGELNERLMKLRELEEKEAEERRSGLNFAELRQSLMFLSMSKDEKTKKQNLQRLDVLGQLGGTPNFMLSPPKEHLVEKYFHPDNMSSSEKMKLELQKVRDEFKMSESDCGSARVQVAQLTTKIKHLSTALHKKDKHSRKGLQAMVQRRKKLLKYLRRTDWDSYCLVLSKLGLRDNPDFKILTYPRKST